MAFKVILLIHFYQNIIDNFSLTLAHAQGVKLPSPQGGYFIMSQAGP